MCFRWECPSGMGSHTVAPSLETLKPAEDIENRGTNNKDSQNTQGTFQNKEHKLVLSDVVEAPEAATHRLTLLGDTETRHFDQIEN